MPQTEITEPEAHHQDDEETQLRDWFSSVDADESGKISAEELRAALMNGDWSPFDIETVKMLMAVFDTNHSGLIEFQEFAKLWAYVKEWQNIFDHYDKDKSGTIDYSELENVLLRRGYNLTKMALNLLLSKYGATIQKNRLKAEGSLSFDRFMRCCAAVKTLSRAFEVFDRKEEGYVKLDYNTFIMKHSFHEREVDLNVKFASQCAAWLSN